LSITILEVGACQEMCRCIPDESIDLVFTDPPYPKEFLHLYDWLGIESFRMLKPGGYLIVYVHQFYMSQVMADLSRLMTYFWAYAYINKGATRIVQQRGMVNMWKPILIYSKGKPGNHRTSADSGTGTRSKFWHTWGQAEETALYLISNFSEPGQTVLDPFVGGGTTPYVCCQLGIDCIGFDLDPKAIEVSLERTSRIQTMLIPPEEYQSDLWVPEGVE